MKFLTAFLSLFLGTALALSECAAVEIGNSGTSTITNPGVGSEYIDLFEASPHYGSAAGASNHDWIVYWTVNASLSGGSEPYNGYHLTATLLGGGYAEIHNIFPLPAPPINLSVSKSGSFIITGGQQFQFDIGSSRQLAYTTTINWFCKPLYPKKNPCSCDCDCGGKSGQDGSSGDPISYNSGALTMQATDLPVRGLRAMSFSRSFGNRYESTIQPLGPGWFVDQLPRISVSGWNPLQAGGNGFVTVQFNGNQTQEFRQVGTSSSAFAPFLPGDEDGFYDLAGDLQHRAENGTVTHFYDFSAALPVAQRGAFKSSTDRAGVVITATYDANGLPTVIAQSQTVGAVTTTQQLVMTYDAVYTTQYATVKWQTVVNNAGTITTTTQRQADYAYYTGAVGEFGETGTLKRVTLRDGAGAIIDQYAYRYWRAGEANGYTGALKYVINPANYARLVALALDPTTCTEAQLTSNGGRYLADNYFEYDATQRVTKEIANHAGANPGTAGTFTYAYTRNAAATTDYNQWMVKNVETLPDGNQNIVYTNYASQVLLKVFKDTVSGAQWMTYSQYDAEGKETLRAEPSAVQSFNDTNVNLGVVLKASSGLISTVTFASATTATLTAPGTVDGQVTAEFVKQGSGGTPVQVKAKSYYQRVDASGAVRNPVATETVYRNENGTGAQTTAYAYTWQGTTNQMASKVTTLPTIPVAQNGPNTTEVRTVFYDALGREAWFKDADGGITYREYDAATGALVKRIIDVNTATTADFANKPSGWTTPSGGGLHLKTLYQVDARGRTVKETDPEGNITWTVYDDVADSVRTYPGWTGTATTGPTVVVRNDHAGNYREVLTMSAAPAVLSGAPTGAEAIASLQSLTRTFKDDGGRTASEDRYISFSGLTYSVTTALGTLNTHFTRTSYAYDARGRRNTVTNAAGTITQTLYDGLDRPITTLKGTTLANLLVTESLEYDGGLVGDGNVTKRTVPVNATATSDRVTQYWYDWRNRLVASKEGIQASESTSTNRQLIYRVLDNLGKSISVRTYDADGITPTVTAGVPVEPAASLRRSQTDTLFDEQGRSYRQQVYSVDLAGVVGAVPLTSDTWYLQRAGSQVVKKSEPGGPVVKYVRDFAGRVTKESLCNAGNDAAWADAFTVSGETVLSQRTTTYDKAGHPLMVQTQDRFHDTVGTGDLGNATTGNKARVSYRTTYYDKAYRVIAEVDVGTNSGVAYTRPASAPARSDTVLVTSYAYGPNNTVDRITDPRGVVTNVDTDFAGRRTKVRENYQSGVNGGNPSGSDINRATSYAYTGIDQVSQITASVPTGGVAQITKYVYGVSSSTYGYNNDLLYYIAYPDKTTGAASTLAADKEVYAYYRDLSRRTMTDGNGNAHGYYYDMVGRFTGDRIGTVGAGTDTAILRLDTSYDSAGRPYKFTSYDTTAATTIVNQVQRTYNGFGQLLTEQQAPNGAINGTGAGTQTVSYAYTTPAAGLNASRLTSVTYPNGRKLRYEYSAGIDANISRPSFLADDNAGAIGTQVEQYSYLGQGRIVKRAHPEPGIDLTRIKLAAEAVSDAGDQYTALDRFGRVVDQRWLKTSDSSSMDRFQYAYDRGGNRLYQNNLVTPVWSELYHANSTAKDASFDKLNRMTEFRRGALSASGLNGNGALLDTVVTAADPNPAVDPVLGNQVLSLDQLGNWTSATEDGTATARTHNAQNQVTAVGASAIGYDNNGNLTTQSPYAANVYDGWNRGVALRGSVFRYDALGRRIMTGTAANGEFYYHSGDQIVDTIPQGTSTKRREQVIWSLEYIDAAILRDRDADGSAATGALGKAASGLEERLYYLHDLRYSTTALATQAGALAERTVYDPYGGTAFFTGAGAVLTNTAYDNTITYTGRYRDVTGLMYFRARYFDPILGRFVSRDPKGYADGMSQYCGYFAPLNVDPSGLEGCEVCKSGNWEVTADAFGAIGAVGLGFGTWSIVGIARCVDDYNVSAEVKTWGIYEGLAVKVGGNIQMFQTVTGTISGAKSREDLYGFASADYTVIGAGLGLIFSREDWSWDLANGVTYKYSDWGLGFSPEILVGGGAYVGSGGAASW